MFAIIEWIFKVLARVLRMIFALIVDVGVYIIVGGFILSTLFTVLF